MKKSITKYHQPCNELIISFLCVILASKKASPSITKYHQLFCSDSLPVCSCLLLVYKAFHKHVSAIYLQVSNFRLHPDVQTLYTPMYMVCRPGCTIAVHPGLHEDLQRAVNLYQQSK